MAKIRKTKSGKWHALVYMGKDENGKKIHKSITNADKQIVKQEADRLESVRENGNASLLFEHALSAYIQNREPVLSPSTIRGYRSIERILKQSYPDACALSLDDLNKTELQALVNDMIQKGKSPKRIRNVYGLITAVLRHYDRVPPQIALPENKPSNIHEPTMNDVKRLREAARGSELDIPIRLGLHGLRQGEVCALKYPDDFQDGYIIVTKSMVEKPDWTYTVKSPKNATSNRRVPIFDDSLLSDIEKQGCVTNLLPDELGYKYATFVKKNNLPHIRFHDLRHFFASYLHSKGIPDALIMKYGGWKTDNVMKRVYRYALDDEETIKGLRLSFNNDFFM